MRVWASYGREDAREAGGKRPRNVGWLKEEGSGAGQGSG